MQISKVARMIAVDRTTIVNWIKNPDLSHLFSESAKNENTRELTEDDLFVSNTIRYLRQNVTTDWQEIAEKIESGYRITDLSISSLEVDTGKTPIQQFTRTLSIAQERDLVAKQLEEAKVELEKLRTYYEEKLEDERRRNREEVQRGREEMERLLREIAELRYEIGRLEQSKKYRNENHQGE